MRKPRNSIDLFEFNRISEINSKERIFFPCRGNGDLEIALIFPNNYSVASSNLGYHKIYYLLNKIDGINCERFFFYKGEKKFFSVDSFRLIDEFKIWAFNISFELDIFNLIDILNQKKIPLLSSKRDSTNPIILIGGSLTYFNPKPLYPLADLIFCGDAENRLEEVVNMLKERIKSNCSRIEVFKSIEKYSFLSSSPIQKKSSSIEHVESLDNFPSNSSFIYKNSEFGGKALIEIGRGCLRNCSFCVASFSQIKARFLSPGKLKEVLNFFKSHGVNDVGLIAATATDYPFLEEILDYLEKKDFSFALSSIRLDNISDALLKGLKRSGQRSITIAPEGGSQKIRDLFKKNISESQISSSLSKIFSLGIKEVKMYFIFGLEEEDEEDLKSYRKIAVEAQRIGFNKIYFSFNPLIPKPTTPFSKRNMQPLAALKEKKSIIQQSLKKVCRIKFESLRESELQFRLANANEDFFLSDENKMI